MAKGFDVVPACNAKRGRITAREYVGKTAGELERRIQVLLPGFGFQLRCRPHQISGESESVLHGGGHAGAASRGS